MQATIERGWGMRKVEVKRDEVLKRIEDNLQKHVAEYKEAVTGYKQESLKRLDELRKKVNDNLPEGSQMVPLLLHLEMPVSHEDDYKQVIEMLKMSVQDTVTLESDEFACYVMDHWKWKQAFTATNNRYTGKGGF
jgi:transketolase